MSDEPTLEALEAIVHAEDLEKIAALAPDIEEAQREVSREKEPDIRQIIQKAGLPQKLKLALFGNSICRLLLIKESNKLIALSVLKNPKIQLTEVESFAKNPNTPDFVLRVIGQDAKFTKHATIKRELVFNPKCPLDVSLTLVKFMSPADIKILSRSKNVPQGLAGYARKRMDALQRK